MIKLAPSILAADHSLLGHQVEIVTKAGADYIHIDVMDGHFVPNISMGFPVLQSLRNKSNLVFDVHLMIDNPKDFIERFSKEGADIITFHIEACASTDEVYEIIKMIKDFGKKAGLALRPETALHDIIEFVPYVDMILIMTVSPGFGGQKFIPQSLDKVRELREHANGLGLNLDIQVDGGIDFDNIHDALKSGANVIVAGSTIFGHDDIYAAARRFKEAFKELRKNKIVILANGETDDLEFSKQMLQDSNFIICCDGGANFATKLGAIPHLIVGDFDSIDEHVKVNFESKNVAFAKFSANKNATDLELAVKLALEKQPSEIAILGGYGGRADHLLGNIQTLVMAAKAGVKACLVSSTTNAFIINGFAEILRQNYKYISLVPLGACASGITTTGLKYPLHKDTLLAGTTVGISNEFIDSVATVTVDNGFLLAICTNTKT